MLRTEESTLSTEIEDANTARYFTVAARMNRSPVINLIYRYFGTRHYKPHDECSMLPI
jgi:hypothetical protein